LHRGRHGPTPGQKAAAGAGAFGDQCNILGMAVRTINGLSALVNQTVSIRTHFRTPRAGGIEQTVRSRYARSNFAYLPSSRFTPTLPNRT